MPIGIEIGYMDVHIDIANSYTGVLTHFKILKRLFIVNGIRLF